METGGFRELKYRLTFPPVKIRKSFLVRGVRERSQNDYKANIAGRKGEGRRGRGRAGELQPRMQIRRWWFQSGWRLSSEDGAAGKELKMTHLCSELSKAE